MGYSIPLQTKVDLSDIGTDNSNNPFFAVVRPMNALPFEQKMQFIEKLQGLFKDGVQEGAAVKISSLDLSAMKELKAAIKPLIVSWNLLDFDDRPVSLEDADALDRVPSIVVERINQAVSGRKQSEETKNSSEQSANS